MKCVTKNMFKHCKFIILIITMLSSKDIFAVGVYSPSSIIFALPDTLVIRANTPAGTVVYTSPSKYTGMRDGATTTSSFDTIYTSNPILSTYGNNIYETGLEGVGFRIRGQFQTPSSQTITQYWGADTNPTYYWLGDSNNPTNQYFYLELVTTTGHAVSGTIDLSSVIAQLTFNYGTAGPSTSNSLVTLTISGTTSVTANSCEINTYDSSVDLGTFYIQQLKGKGTTTGSQNFQINMTCSELSLVPSVTFSGVADSSGLAFGNDSGDATGVGVQLSYENNVIIPDQKIKLVTPTTTTPTDYTFKAALYQTEDSVTVGSLDSNVTFILEYE